MGLYDVPANIDTVLRVSGYPTLNYVGHSQGTTQMFVAATLYKDLAQKVDHFFALAPVVYVAHTRSPILTAMAELKLASVISSLGMKDFLPEPVQLIPWLCDFSVVAWVCESAVYALAGAEIERDNMAVYLSHFPAGTSIQDMMHWAQAARNKDFRRHDYGSPEANIEHYGTHFPPAYDLRNYPSSGLPVSMFTGGKDVVSTMEDVRQLVREMPPSPYVTHTHFDDFDHLSFTWGKAATGPVYNAIIATMDTAGGFKSVGDETSGKSAGGFGHTTVVVVGVASACGLVLAAVAVVMGKKRTQPLTVTFVSRKPNPALTRSLLD
jgi:pimeloyl-ACP methyl ester carboxylesterase